MPRRATQAGFVPGLGGLPADLDRLLRLIDGYVSALAELGVLNRAFLLLWAEAATASELAPVFRERDDAFRADLRDDVRAGIADGTVRPDASPARPRSRSSGNSARSGCSGCWTRRPSTSTGCATPSPSTGVAR
jgi:transcriptional regulator BetI-like protein